MSLLDYFNAYGTAAVENFQAIVVDEVIPAVRRCGGAKPVPSPYEAVQAASLLAKVHGSERTNVVRLLKQGGFDVGALDSMPAPRPVPAVTEAPAAAAAHAMDAAGNDGLVREFLEDVLPRAHWDMLPFGFLHDLYLGWLAASYPGSWTCGRNQLIEAIGRVLEGGGYGWKFPERNAAGQSRRRGPRTA